MNQGVTVLDCDSCSPDNPTAGAAAAHPDSGLDVRLAIVHSRYLYHDYDAGVVDQEATDALARYMAATIQGMLRRMGLQTPVFIGEPFRSVMGPKQHVDETDYDLHGDGGREQPAGNFADALAYQRELALQHRINIINAGPAHGVAKTMQMLGDAGLFGQLGRLVTQGGVLDLPKLPELHLVGGPGMTYNWACDNQAASRMLRGHPDVSVITPNHTKDPRLGVWPDQLEAMGVHPVLAAPYREHFEAANERTPSRRGKPLAVHDLHLVFMLRQLLLGEAGPYTWAPLEMKPPVPWMRQLVKDVDADMYFELMRRFTCN
ncbi:MAG TPA: hypothetical protein VMT30_03390 [Candidatus Saccharimonadia bacterium]|nr:hypothetical protein [Candidatus Saccharimonadia bacterium]